MPPQLDTASSHSWKSSHEAVTNFPSTSAMRM
jgi:hypothetical protein